MCLLVFFNTFNFHTRIYKVCVCNVKVHFRRYIYCLLLLLVLLLFCQFVSYKKNIKMFTFLSVFHSFIALHCIALHFISFVHQSNCFSFLFFSCFCFFFFLLFTVIVNKVYLNLSWLVLVLLLLLFFMYCCPLLF